MHPGTNRKSLIILAALAGAFPVTSALAGDAAQVKRGGQLVVLGGCSDCHTPSKMGPKGPEKDTARGLSGHPEDLRLPPPPALEGPWNWAGSATMTAFAGPWGISYAANLTPDGESGIGSWREKDFIQSMRTGKHLGVARPILPPMPWQALGSLPDNDLRAIFAYLKAQPAVKNKVPVPVPPAPPAAKPGY